MKDWMELRSLQQQAALEELRACNERSSRFGLVLNEEEIRELVESRKKALTDTGRIEFGGGILPKLVDAFCDSPYMDPRSYASVLTELQEAFYYFKGEAQERFSDDDLVEFMVKVFNGRAQGSAEYLIGSSLEELCRYADRVFDPYDADEAGDLF